jgi:hypothetical protein
MMIVWVARGLYIPHIFQDAGVHAEYELEPLMRKDSLELTDAAWA